ncbi:hypothetical protein GOV11_02635 [Candidatus Woesearchaeota archaeon]|nr:hypothetical protein [Candidatus Woesearchaeota archaeon]
MKELQEGATSFVTDSSDKISKEMPVFYNPVMKLNRDLSLLVIASMKSPRIGLPMEASGIRAARILNEIIAPGIVTPKMLSINDLSKEAISLAKKNVARQQGIFPSERITFSQTEASLFLKQSRGFDYIDIDPFGTPNPFLDATVTRIARNGIIAVTATDTSALAGTYPNATKRKYWATPCRCWAMHEIGLRILIRKVQLVGTQHDKALIPLLSVSADHYYRIFFRCEGKSQVKDVLSKHSHIQVNEKKMSIKISENSTDPGPLWIGPMHDKEFVQSLINIGRKLNISTFHDSLELLGVIKDECKIESLGFFETNTLSALMKITPIKREKWLELLGKHGCRTHITPMGIKSDLSFSELSKLV